MLALASAGFEKQRWPHLDLVPTTGSYDCWPSPGDSLLLHLAPLATGLQHERAPGFPPALELREVLGGSGPRDSRALGLRVREPAVQTFSQHILVTSLLFGFLIHEMGIIDDPGPSYLPLQAFSMVQGGEEHGSPTAASPSLSPLWSAPQEVSRAR